MATSDYLALDLGAESGRGVLGRFDGRLLNLEEVHRFSNEPVRMRGTLYWDLPRLYQDIKNAVQKTRALHVQLDAIGVDTWGVDFGLIGKHDTLLGNPVHYRDARTEGILDIAFGMVPKEKLYEWTGLQFLPFNTAFQLLAMHRADSPLLEAAETLLMMPDLIGWLLTGVRAGEFTDASTMQLLDPRTRTWNPAVFQGLDLPNRLMPDLIEPGSTLGMLSAGVAEETGCPIVPVIAPATHDTASAVVAVPVRNYQSTARPNWCYLSSGTWSLLGVETPEPIINEQTFAHNFTNEGGLRGTNRLLKNIMGLWIVQECRRTWARAGRDWTYEELIPRAYSAPAFAALVDPDYPGFMAPGDMPARLAAYCQRTGQPVPRDEGGFVRCALESLALKYRWTIQRLEAIVGTSIETIHVVGGGTQNTLLCQFTADATGKEVHAGPIEATAIGNILVQALGRGKLAHLGELREVVARSFPVAVYEPRDTNAWDDAYGRFEALIGR